MSTAIEKYLKQPDHLALFEDVLGKSANSYVQSVIIAAQDEALAGCTPAQDEALAGCTPESVMKAALRAASQGLSCDPIQREAQLIPRMIKGVKTACFDPHYLGLYKMAMRTEIYRSINVVPVLKGQEVRMGIDGVHQVYENDKPVVFFPTFKATAASMENVIGLLGHYITFKGQAKTVYMTMEEIEDHAKKYSAAYRKDIENKTKNSLWANPEIRPTMQMKTVLRELLKWADLSGGVNKELVEVITAGEEEDVISIEAEDVGEDGNVYRTDAVVLQSLIDHKVAVDEKEAKEMMELCRWENQPADKFLTWAVVMRGWMDAGENKKNASRKANEGKRPI